MRELLRPGRCALLLAGALALSACAPAPAPPPGAPPATTTTTAPPLPGNQCTEDPPPTAYAAVVDTPDSATPDVVRFSAANSEEKTEKIAALEEGGDVVAVEREQKVELLDTQVTTNDEPNYTFQWGLRAAKFDLAWAVTPGHLNGAGQTIAVIDTGVQGTHPDLGTAKVLPGIDQLGFYPDGRTDPHGHGTHVAGIAAAGDNGLGGLGGAPGAAILPVRVLNSCGAGITSTVAAGIIWAVDNGATVINLSLGSSGLSSVVQTAVDHANTHGVTVVAAAGNCGAGGQACGSINAASFPAALNGNVIAAAATDQSGAKAPYSNSNSYVDIAGPGSGIHSTIPTSTYGFKSGTSMATPFVAAAAALLREHCPGISPSGVFGALTGNDGPQIGGLPAGVGLVNADALVTLGACPA